MCLLSPITCASLLLQLLMCALGACLLLFGPDRTESSHSQTLCSVSTSETCHAASDPAAMISPDFHRC